MIKYRPVKTEGDVTQEILIAAQNVADDFFEDKELKSSHDWDLFWNKLEDYRFPDGGHVDLGEMYRTPAMKKIKKHIRTYRENG